MNTLSFKTTLTLALIVLSSGTTRTSSFARMAKKAVPVASLAFFAQQQKASQTDEAKKHVATSQPTFTGPTFNTPIAAAVAQTKTATALSWIRSLLPVARCEEMKQQPSAEQKPSIDFSKIRKVSEAVILPEWKDHSTKTCPKIAKYTLPTGQEIWFFCDYHFTQECTEFITTVLQNQTSFTKAIIECEMVLTALTLNQHSTFKDAQKIQLSYNNPKTKLARPYHSMMEAQALLSEQENITDIIAGEYTTSQEALNAYKTNGISSIEFLLSIVTLAGGMIPIASEDVIEKIFGDLTLKQLDNWVKANIEFISNNLNTFIDTIMYIRDKKIAQTIVETVTDPKNENILIMYGYFHWLTLEKFLEQYLGKPEIITPELFEEMLARKQTDMITAEEYAKNIQK